MTGESNTGVIGIGYFGSRDESRRDERAMRSRRRRTSPGGPRNTVASTEMFPRGGDSIDRDVRTKRIPNPAACNPSDRACELTTRTK
jgi:hypothetical protein